MKQDIHPKYFPSATVACACGNTWQTGSTVDTISTDVCSNCHPFYTGEQRIVDTEGQVDRFYKRLQAREHHMEEIQERESARTSPELPLIELELGKRTLSVLAKAGIETTGGAIARIAEGDAAILAIDGFGRKSLAELKRGLKRHGFKLPEDTAEVQSP